MNKNIILTVFVFSLLLLTSSLVVAAEKEITFVSPASNEEIESDNVDYEVNIDFPSENISAYEVDLYTESNEFLGGDSGVNQNSVSGTFIIDQDGVYYLQALFLLDDGSLISEKVTFRVNFSINNPEIKILGYKNPTPFNGAIINSHNIGSAKIIAVANKDTDFFVVHLWNDTNDQYYNSALLRETDFSILEGWNVDFSDGIYSFNTEANVSSLDLSDVSPTRTITIKATVPNATYTNASFPVSVNEDANFAVDLFDVMIIDSEMSESWNLRIDAYNGFDYGQLGPETVSNSNAGNKSISGNIAEPGIYNLTLVISDDYGNSNSYELGELTVNDVAEPTPIEERRRGRGGNNDEVVNDTKPTSRFNLTLIDLNENNNETPEETEEETESEPGFFSFITGAVTGAFSTPPRAVLTFIIIIVIIYAIIKIRGYIVADNSNESKPKKNGKKAKKEEAEESESN